MKRTLEEFAAPAAVACRARMAAFTDVVSDSRTLKRGQLFVALQGPNFNGQDFVGAALHGRCRRRGGGRSAAGGAAADRGPRTRRRRSSAPRAAGARTLPARWSGSPAATARPTAKEMTASILAQAGSAWPRAATSTTTSACR